MMVNGWVIVVLAALLMTAVAVGVVIGRRQRHGRRHTRSEARLAQRHARPHAALQAPRRGRHADEHVPGSGRHHQPDAEGPREPGMHY